MNALRKLMSQFIEEYMGPKISIVALGCGVNLSQLLSIPGASDVVHSIIFPYSTSSVDGLIENYLLGSKIEKYFSELTSKVLTDLAIDLIPIAGGDVIGIGLSGALTTNRYRKGENGVYAGISDGIETIDTQYLELPKLSEEEYKLKSPQEISEIRLSEDLQITKWIIESLINLEIKQ